MLQLTSSSCIARGFSLILVFSAIIISVYKIRDQSSSEPRYPSVSRVNQVENLQPVDKKMQPETTEESKIHHRASETIRIFFNSYRQNNCHNLSLFDQIGIISYVKRSRQPNETYQYRMEVTYKDVVVFGVLDYFPNVLHLPDQFVKRCKSNTGSKRIILKTLTSHLSNCGQIQNARLALHHMNGILTKPYSKGRRSGPWLFPPRPSIHSSHGSRGRGGRHTKMKMILDC